MNMRRCSVTKHLQIAPGCLDDYKQLAHFHYRDTRPGGFTAVYVIRPARNLAGDLAKKTIGVITYRMPSPEVALRRMALCGVFAGLDTPTQVALVNKNIRCIARVIIEPRFRGLGLASRLVRETMPKMNVPVIEAMAMMGLVNPFFERAGMTACTAKTPARCVQLLEALSLLGIEQELLIDPKKVQQKLDNLNDREAEFIEFHIRRFLDSYGDSRNRLPGLERTRFILSKLTFRPVYYIWLNPEMKLVTN
jgi:GNAT superfamily N-acetyltransferase